MAKPIRNVPMTPSELYSEVVAPIDFQSMCSTSLNTVVLQDDHCPINRKLATKAHHNRIVDGLRPSPSNTETRPPGGTWQAVSVYSGVPGSSVGSNCSSNRGNRGSALFRRTMKRGDSGNHSNTTGTMTADRPAPRNKAPSQPYRGRMNACMAAPINVPPCAPHTVIVE